jgi:membrane AbrB-like protein
MAGKTRWKPAVKSGYRLPFASRAATLTRRDTGGLFSWAALIFLTLPLILLLEQVAMPAASLLGAIAAAIFLALRAVKLRVPDILFFGAQSMLGCIIAHSFSLPVLYGMLDNWAMALGAVLAVVFFSAVIGWVVTIKQILPGSTGIWGTSPGAATPMTLMCEAFGADMRLVAFMQYLRVVLVAGAAALAARASGAPLQQYSFVESLFPALDWLPLAQTMLLAAVCGFLGWRAGMPGAPMLLPMFAGTLLQNFDLMRIETPGWVQVCTYALVGWSIGMRFNRESFGYALRLLPKIFCLIMLMLALSGGLAALLHFGAGIDLLTAYLAASPGGIDAVAIIVSSSKADTSFVMAIQTARTVVVLLIGPPLARLATARARKRLKLELPG